MPPLPRPEDSSFWNDASQNVAQSMIRSHMRSVLRSIAEQNEDWLEPLVEVWCRHIQMSALGNDDGSVIVSWLRNELDVWKRKDHHNINHISLGTEEDEEREVDLDLHCTEVPLFPKRPVTAWARLRRLGKPNDRVLDPIVNDEPSYEEKLQQAIAQLDHYGMTNQTYWLHDQWPVILRAAQHMRARLHPPPKDPAAIPSSDQPLQTWDSQLSQALLSSTPFSPENDLPNETMQQLVDRKRKSVNKKRQWNAALQQFVPKQKRKKTAPVDLDTPSDCDDDIPRPASQDSGSAQLDWKRAMEEDSEFAPRGWSIDDFIHSSATNDSGTARLLGALRDVGHFHGYHQSHVDAAAVVRPRDALRARLGNHRPEEIKKQRPWSRVLRTVADRPQQHWFDLDVGHCILESDGALNAFRSLEMCLRDEDT